MGPSRALSAPVLRANLAAWREHCGVPVRAVVKAAGYGWGMAALVAALDDLVAGYCVVDEDEFRALRKLTALPIAVLNDVAPEAVAGILSAGGLPAVSAAPHAEAAAAWAHAAGACAVVRVGVSSAIGWSGIAPADAAAFAPLLARPGLAVELWTHLTSASLAEGQTAALYQAAAVFREAGVDVRGLDCESTAPAARRGRAVRGNHLRLGAGLFGAAMGEERGPVLQCAMEVQAPVVRRTRTRSGSLVGYGDAQVAAGRELITVRCGYADGFPRTLAGHGKILAVGMQYTTALTDNAQSELTALALIDASSKIDELAVAAGCLPHEIIVGLGNHHTTFVE